ncbi:MAG: ThuA domain-containing protein [Pseudomonadota bacterium]
MPRCAPLTLAMCLFLGALACGETPGASSDVQPGAVAGGTSSGGTGLGGTATAEGATAGMASGGTTTAGTASGGTTTAGAATGGAGSSTGGVAGNATHDGVSLLVFSRTVEYRHDSIPAGVQALTELAAERGWALAATEDARKFSDTGLAAYNAVIFLSTTGNVLDDPQQAAFERFIRAGKGFIGIHSATDTEYDWAWYGGLVGAYFREHPAVQSADVVVEETLNPATTGLPNPWRRSDEWYAFQSNPRPNVHVLLSLDESSYSPGSANMNGDHPIAWCHDYDGGRAFYTALGHTSDSFSDPLFIAQLAGAVTWVLAR